MVGFRGPGLSARDEVPPLAVLGDADTHLAAARGLTVNDQSLVVLVAVPVHVQTEVRTMALLLIGAIPLLVGLVSLAV